MSRSNAITPERALALQMVKQADFFALPFTDPNSLQDLAGNSTLLEDINDNFKKLFTKRGTTSKYADAILKLKINPNLLVEFFESFPEIFRFIQNNFSKLQPFAVTWENARLETQRQPFLAYIQKKLKKHDDDEAIFAIIKTLVGQVSTVSDLREVELIYVYLIDVKNRLQLSLKKHYSGYSLSILTEVIWEKLSKSLRLIDFYVAETYRNIILQISDNVQKKYLDNINVHGKNLFNFENQSSKSPLPFFKEKNAGAKITTLLSVFDNDKKTKKQILKCLVKAENKKLYDLLCFIEKNGNIDAMLKTKVGTHFLNQLFVALRTEEVTKKNTIIQNAFTNFAEKGGLKLLTDHEKNEFTKIAIITMFEKMIDSFDSKTQNNNNNSRKLSS